jgi:hypothetical protein
MCERDDLSLWSRGGSRDKDRGMDASFITRDRADSSLSTIMDSDVDMDDTTREQVIELRRAHNPSGIQQNSRLTPDPVPALKPF